MHFAGEIRVFLLQYVKSLSKKFYIKRNKSKVNSIETGRTVIVHLFPWSDQENCNHVYLIIDEKVLWLLLYL